MRRIPLLALKGRRKVATGGAQRNPWIEAAVQASALKGQRRRTRSVSAVQTRTSAAPSGRWVGGRQPRVPLRVTRGHDPLPLRGKSAQRGLLNERSFRPRKSAKNPFKGGDGEGKNPRMQRSGCKQRDCHAPSLIS